MSITMADVEGKLHVVMFPWAGFGHMLTYVQLAKLIAGKGHKVSFVSTTKNIDRVAAFANVPQCLAPLITFVKLQLPKVEGLHDGAESSMDMARHEIHYLMKARDDLEPQLTRFLKAESPDWIIYDFCDYWVPRVAMSLGISRAFFSIFNAWFLAFGGSSPDDMINHRDVRKTPEDWMVPPPWIPFPSKVGLKPNELEFIDAGFSTDNASGISIKFRVGSVLGGADAIFVRHSLEFEPEWLSLLEKIWSKPVIPVGLLPPSKVDMADTKNDNSETWLTIKKWLDGQTKGSVVYIAFGSEAPLSQDQLTELAFGLEQSGLPFFWVLRKPKVSTESASGELPDGFLERTKGRGMVWTSWVPQLKILGHDSVGGFVTHSGWSSVIEALMVRALPLILLPLMEDQGPNARVIADRMLGIEVPRNADGSFTRNSMADSLRLIMVKDEGRIYKEKAKEFSEINGDEKLHYKYMDVVVDHLKARRDAIANKV